jgi:hypothetical protein
MSRWVCRFSLVRRRGQLFEGGEKECRLLGGCSLGGCLVGHRGLLLCLRVVLWLWLGDVMRLDGCLVEVVVADVILVVVTGMLKQV